MSSLREMVFCFIFGLLCFYECNSSLLAFSGSHATSKLNQVCISQPPVVKREPYIPNQSVDIMRQCTEQIEDFEPLLIEERFLAPNTKIVFSIDGGGSRGYIPAYFVSELLNRINDTRLPVDMLAGTSVGSLISAAIAVDRGEELYEQFPQMAKFIFKKRWKSCGGLFGPRYGTSGMKQIINEYIDENAGNLASRYNINTIFCCAKTNRAFVFRNYDETPICDFRDALIASASAPSYFKTHSFMGLDGRFYEGVDGGVWKNNPAYLSYQDMRLMYPDDPIVVISLGTGNYSPVYSPSTRKGILCWAPKFPDLAIASTAYGDHEQLLREEIYNPNIKYIRINPSISKEMFSTDCISNSYFKSLDEACQRYVTSDIGKCALNEVTIVLLAHKYYIDRGLLF